jgi:hypothetical protein
MTLATTTDWLALYGALASTASGAWAVYQWWTRGPKLKLTASPNMIIAGGNLGDQQQKYISVVVRNRGREPTTITNFALFGYDTWLKYLLKINSYQAVVNQSLEAYRLPFVLTVGSEWSSLCIQNAEVEELSRSKIMCTAIYHSFSEKPVRSGAITIPSRVTD